jgi:hypothetical protein
MAIKKLDLLRVITSSNYLYNFSSSYSNKAKTASYALNASGGGGSSLRTGSTYPITASYANRAITASYALNASGGGSSLAGAQTFVSNGSQTIYTLNQSVVNRDQILVVTNGVVQSRTGSNYTVSGTTLTLSEAVQSGGLVDVRYINAGQGSSGTSGANGTSGTNGTSGANGTSGTSGAGSTLATGSTYPITSSYARKSVTASYLTTISQSLIPAKNNVYSLGSPTKKWKDIYVSTASIYFDNYPLRVAVKNNSAQLLFNTRSIVTVPSGSNPSTSSYATKALTASYSLNSSAGGSTLRTGSTYPITSSFARRAITASYALNTFFQTGSIVKQTILYNVVSGSSNTISGLSLGGNKWDVSVVEEWDAISGDLFYNSCSLLMHFSGSNGSTTFTDNSPSTKTVTSNNGASISSAQSKFGSRSGLFDGVDDYLIISGNTVCNFGSGDFTVECWVRLNAMPTSDAWPTNFSSHFVVITAGTPSAGDGIGFLIGQTKLIVQSNDTQMPNALHGMTTNTWYHIAYVRRGNNLYFFVNGSQVGTTQTLTGAVGTGTNTYIGCETAQGAFFNGYMDELRVTKGLARYVSNFTTSSTEFGNVRGQVATKYIGTVGGLNDRSVDYGVQKLTDSSLKVIKMSSTALPYPPSSGSLSQSVSRVYVNVLDYTKVAVTSSYASRALTASYALNASGGGGSTLRTGSTYPITSSFARRAITASYALNSSGGGSTLRTGSTYPITSSYARRAITASYALNASGGGSTLRTGSTYPFTSSWSTRTSAIANSTTNRIPKYTAANTLSTTVSPIFESGSAFIGIGPISTSLVSRLQVYRSGSNSSVFRVDGGSGTLFEVTDALSGSLFSVNDITGLPIFEVFSNNRVIAGTVNSNALVVTGSSVGIGTSTPQTKLHVLGNISGSQFTSSRRNAVGFSGTASYARRSLTASYALNASGGGGGSTLRTGSTYPITSSWSTRTTAIANSTTNRIPKYTAANTLSTTVSPIFESGSAFIGVGPISTSLVSRLQVYRSGSNASVFRVDGGSGTLFEVTDALSGSLFSVNDITGLPIFEVFSNNRVIAGTVNSNALVVTGSNVGIGTSVPAVKLQVSGTIAPAGDNIHPLGRSTNRFSDVFAAQTTIGGLFETGLRTDKLGQLPTGTIVSWEVNGCVASSKEEDELVMGVVKNGKDEPLILGAEPILVTGVVNVGDYIVTSNKVGHGKAIKRGNIFKKDLFGKVIAQALESGNGESYLIKGMIRKM